MYHGLAGRQAGVSVPAMAALPSCCEAFVWLLVVTCIRVVRVMSLLHVHPNKPHHLTACCSHIMNHKNVSRATIPPEYSVMKWLEVL